MAGGFKSGRRVSDARRQTAGLSYWPCSYRWLVVCTVAVLAIGLTIGYIHLRTRGNKPADFERVGRSSKTLLMALAAGEFAWSESTTPIPISTASVWLKLLLSGGAGAPVDLRRDVPPADTIQVGLVRDWMNRKRFDRIIVGMCDKQTNENLCDPVEKDKVYGLTPLHLAAASGDQRLYKWLLEHGADPDVADSYGRKPANLTFANFIANSKRWARQAGRLHCDIPEVVFADGASDTELEHARNEVRRLIGEGEPVLMRGAFMHFSPELVVGWKVEQFVHQHGDVQVRVGPVPYASSFNMTSMSMSIREYYERHVKVPSDVPLYVFDKEPSVNRRGYEAIVHMLRALAPIPELIADPEDVGGLDGIHFFLGRENSGAPHHHADALNVVVSGSKRWFIYTPSRTLYSRKHIKRWLDEDYEGLAEAEKPLECIQRPGDVIYVPLDWGHAVINLEENTFGYALELLNKRDTFAEFDRLPQLQDEL
jgi:hypothetical protein